MRKRMLIGGWLRYASLAAATGAVFQTAGCFYNVDNVLPNLVGTFTSLAISGFVRGALNVTAGFGF